MHLIKVKHKFLFGGYLLAFVLYPFITIIQIFNNGN